MKHIPAHIQIAPKVWYEVVWVKEFSNKKQVGEIRYCQKQILLKLGEKEEETYSTFMHEIIHGFSAAYKLNLTEKQVLGLEKAIGAFLKLNAK